MDWEQVFKFPLQDPDWLKKILIGCLISMVPVLNILSLGYFMECITRGAKGRSTLPEWDNWREHLQQGLMALLITACYGLIPFMVLILPGIGVFLFAVVFIIIGIMVPMALANYAINQEFKSAVGIIEIFQQISRVTNYYITAYFAIILVLALGSSIFIGIPYLAFLGASLVFYCGIIYFFMVGQLYNEALEQ